MLSIDERLINHTVPPYVIAEMSGNHNQSLERALEIVEAAADCGVHALKLQTYTPDTLTIDSDRSEFFISDKKSLWKGRTLYELYKDAYTPWEWHKQIFDRCRELDLTVFSTPFDDTAVDFLESLDVPAYKIASFENADLPLIKKVASTGKPIFMSTGMASLPELDESVRTARDAGCKDLILLKCTSTYPSDPVDSNILTIPHMIDTFDCMVGISDHTLGIGAAVASVALGAVAIEKHFTLSRDEGGVDSAFSLEPLEMKMLVEETRIAHDSLGSVHYGTTQSEKKSVQFRRSIFVVEDIKKGELLTQKNVRIIRPGHGLAPKHFEAVMGERAIKNIKRGTPIKWELLK